VKRIDGFPWRVTVHIDMAGNLISGIECLKSEESKVWECEATSEVKLVNHNDYSRSMCEEAPKRSWDMDRVC
ncbi:hypothetical protein PENTCL1PPCAC_23806, partial [Pristionchus entomophagus]